MSDTKDMVVVDHLSKTYQSKTSSVRAIGDLHFTIQRGEFACIVGPSGAGKTTLLKCLSGLLEPTSGSVTVNGRLVKSPPADMAFVLQEYGRSLFPWVTVGRNVEMPLLENRTPKQERRRRVADALAAVGLADAADRYPWQLSGGMQQRVAIARAVAYQPKVLVMDEPFAAVDAQTRADLEDLVRRLWQELGLTVLFVTHDIDEAVYVGTRVIVLSSAPTFVQDDVAVDLGTERDQIGTRALPEFVELRTRVYEGIQRAKAAAVARAS